MALWDCPECGATKKVVCRVCSLKKKAGETCAACGSEYSHTSCHECGYSEQHLEPMKFHSYDEKIRAILKTRTEKYLTYYELMRLAALIKPSALEDIAPNDPIDVKNLTQYAFKKDEAGSITALCALKGITPDFARALLKKVVF